MDELCKINLEARRVATGAVTVCRTVASQAQHTVDIARLNVCLVFGCQFSLSWVKNYFDMKYSLLNPCAPNFKGTEQE